MKEFLELLKRGTVEIISDAELTEKLKQKKQLRVKLGVDPTAKDLHLGHTVLLRKLRLFQDYGHKVIFIIGDFTARIGDPSGQDKTRPVISEEDILKNAETYTEQVFKILDKSKTEVVFNSSWLKELGITGLLNLCARYTVSRMLERDDFSQRYKNNSPISIIEFIYPLLQGYDSVAIQSDIELGGNDQKFNLLVGRELQRDFGQVPQVVMTLPLLVGLDGTKKMSKSYKNYIGITEPSKDMFGKLMSIPDNLMYTYYELLTNSDLNSALDQIKAGPRNAKANLAHIITEQYYGEKTADAARAEFDNVFSKKSLPENMPEYKTDKPVWDTVSQLITTISNELDSQTDKISRKEAKRLIEQNAVELSNNNGAEFTKISEDKNINLGKEIILKVGKRKYYKIILK